MSRCTPRARRWTCSTRSTSTSPEVPSVLDMPRVREVFEASTDFTVGLEEEFAILDPRTLSLDQRFEELRELAQEDSVLAESVAGELIRSEIEIRSGRGETFADAVAKQREARTRLFALAARN